MSSTPRRLGAALAAVALSASLVGVSHAAFADVPDGFVDSGTIDTSKQGTITVHKKAETGNQTPGNIYTPGSVNGAGVPGSIFTAYKLNIDLTNNQGWDKVSKIQGDLTEACVKAQEGSLTYSVGGQAALAGGGATYVIDASDDGEGTSVPMPLGAYLVCETQLPANALRKADPFVVTLPSPATKAGGGGTSAGWVYNVNVFPKNVLIDNSQVTKTVARDETKLASEDGAYTFTLSTVIPALPAGDQFAYFQFADNLASSFANITVQSVAIADPNGDDLAVSDYESSVTKKFMIVSLKKDGLTKLKNNGGKTLTVTFKATSSTPDWVGTHTNKGAVAYKVEKRTAPPDNPNNPWTPGKAPEPDQPIPPTPDKKFESNEVSANAGQVKLKKVAQGTQTALKGAIFKLYAADLADTAECDAAHAATIAGKSTTKLVKEGLESNVNGEILVKGLKIDAKKEAAANLAAERCYIFEETQAPLGYVLPTNDAKYTAVLAKVEEPSAGANSLVTVPNTVSKVPDLPLTGASGQLLMLIGGTSLVLFAAGGLMVARRKGSRA